MHLLLPAGNILNNTTIKDHYKILGLQPSATLSEIKKAYRRLAMQYHPDKNPDNQYAEAQFKEIQEAYSILSNPLKREKYHDDLWMNGAGRRTHNTQEVTPSWLLTVAIDMNKSLAAMDTYRISQRALQEYILLILTDAHIGVLRRYNDEEKNAAIRSEIMKATQWLGIQYLEIIVLQILKTTDDIAIQREIYQFLKSKEQQAKKRQLMPLVIMLITIVLCVLMYFYGTK